MAVDAGLMAGLGAPRRPIAGLFVLLASLLLLPPAKGSSQEPPLRTVGVEKLLEAMRRADGYDPTATTNAARFQAEVLLHLTREALDEDPSGPPLFIGHQEWFEAFLAVTGLTADSVPLYLRLAHEYGQDHAVDYRQERVIEAVEEGRTPDLAVNVILWWPEGDGVPDQYSYEDTLSTPRLKVTDKSVITYRLLDFGDMVAWDELEGLKGRPTSGALGLLFRVIGEGSVKWSRMAISPDSLQVTRGQAKKTFISVESTVTVYPDGRTEKDTPPDRPDLQELDARLREPLKVDYVPLAWDSLIPRSLLEPETPPAGTPAGDRGARAAPGDPGG